MILSQLLKQINGLPYRFRLSKVSKDVAWSSLASIIVKIRGIILISVIGHFIGVNWYGAWSLIFTFSSYATILATLMLSNAIVRFFPEEGDNKNNFFTFIFSIVLLLSLSISFAILPLADRFAIVFLKDKVFSGLVFWGAFLVPLNALKLMLQDYFRAKDDLKTFSIIESGFTILEILVLLVIISFTKDLVFALKTFLIIGFALEVMIMLRILKVTNLKNVWSNYNLNRLVEYLKYSLPLVPNGFLTLISANGDRFIIGYFLGAEAVGLYSAAYALASTVMLFNPPITNALFPKVSKCYVEGNLLLVKKYVKIGIRTFLVIGFSMLVLIVFYGNTLLHVLVGEITPIQHYKGIQVTFVIISALVIYGVSRIYSLHLFVLKKTQSLFFIYFSGTVVNVVFNLALIKLFGLLGAAVSTLLSYIVISLAILYAVKANESYESIS